ncbi:MAG TPA: hypothetical protein VJ833_03920 [Rhodanobacteraceae bacterium]|nr:hypothetical protein [Rhodanobacteraceae bacterium]
MEGRDLVWDHFKFNAEQRLKGFNFFVLLSIFADGGVFTAIEQGVNSRLLLLLGLFTALLAIVFWLIDSRSRRLILLTIPALKEIESAFPESYRLFAIDAMKQGSIVRYTVAIRVLLAAQFCFGIGVSLYGVCRW